MTTAEALAGLKSPDALTRYATCNALAKRPALDEELMGPLLTALLDRESGTGLVNRGGGSEPEYFPIAVAARDCLRAHSRTMRGQIEEAYFAGSAELQVAVRRAMRTGFIRGEGDGALVSLGSAAAPVIAWAWHHRGVEFRFEGDVNRADSRRGRPHTTLRREATLHRCAALCRVLATGQAAEYADPADEQPSRSAWSFEHGESDFLVFEPGRSPTERFRMRVKSLVQALTHEVRWALARVTDEPQRRELDLVLRSLAEARVRYGLPSDRSVPSPITDVPTVELTGTRGKRGDDAVHVLTVSELVKCCETLAVGGAPELMEDGGPLIIERALVIRALRIELPWLLSHLPAQHVDRPKLERCLVNLDAAMERSPC